MSEQSEYLYEARKSLWDAIDNYGPLDKAFGKKYRLDDDAVMLPEEIYPSLSDLPALAIMLGAFDPPENYHQRSFGLMPWYHFVVFTAGWGYSQIERLAMHVLAAVYSRSANLAAVSAHPVRVGQIVPQLVRKEGMPTVTRWTIPILLRIKFQF